MARAGAVRRDVGRLARIAGHQAGECFFGRLDLDNQQRQDSPVTRREIVQSIPEAKFVAAALDLAEEGVATAGFEICNRDFQRYIIREHFHAQPGRLRVGVGL